MEDSLNLRNRCW